MTHRTRPATGSVAGFRSLLLGMLLALLGSLLGTQPAHAADQGTCLRNGMVWVALGNGAGGCAAAGSGQAALQQVFGAPSTSPNGMTCQIAGYPSVNNCTYARNGWDPATQEYLVYWHYYPCTLFPGGYGGNPCDAWVYSQKGGSDYVAPGGSVDLWQYGTTQTYPGIAVAPIPAPAPPPPPPPAPPAAPAAPAAPVATDAPAPVDPPVQAAPPAQVAPPAAEQPVPTAHGTASAPAGDLTSAPAGDSTSAPASAPAATATAAAPSNPATPPSSAARTAAGTPLASASVAAQAAPAAAPTDATGSPVGTLVALGLIAALAAGGGGWYLWHRRRA